MLIIPAGDDLIVYGPVSDGGFLGYAHTSDVRVDGRFVVIENYTRADDPNGKRGSGEFWYDAREIVVVDTTTRRYAMFHGHGVEKCSLRATGTIIAVDGNGCHVTQESDPIP
jgi:hypothetical protein